MYRTCLLQEKRGSEIEKKLNVSRTSQSAYKPLKWLHGADEEAGFVLRELLLAVLLAIPAKRVRRYK